MAKQPITNPLQRRLVRAIESGEETFLGLERKTGVLRQSLMIFARGEGTIFLSAADELAAYFGMEMVERSKRSQHGGND